MQRLKRFSAGSALVAITMGFGVATPRAEEAPPTFSADVAPILYENCVTCHRTGEAAPMSLITYAETRPWSRSIKNKVITGEMPPWHANPAVGSFANARGLTDAEKDTIVRWVDGGTPEGERADLPPAPQFADGWQIGTPDVIIEMPEPFEVPAEGAIPYQNIPVQTGFTEDTWVQAFEVRAGARPAVHHIILYLMEDEGAPQEKAYKEIPVGPVAEAVFKRNAERAAELGMTTSELGFALNALVDGRYTEAPRIHRLQRSHRLRHTEAVGIGLHHREQARIRTDRRSDRPGIPQESRGIDFGPGSGGGVR